MKQGTVRKAGRIAAMWVPALFLVFVFGNQGWSKFSETSGWATAFRHWGYPDWFRILIGVVEVTAAACLLWGRTAVVGAVLIICVMAGGMSTHILQDGGRHLTSEVMPMVLSLVILVLRREQLRGLFRRSAVAAVDAQRL
jgi:putative oxidoreductase